MTDIAEDVQGKRRNEIFSSRLMPDRTPILKSFKRMRRTSGVGRHFEKTRIIRGGVNIEAFKNKVHSFSS
jgi:hypothetical protein